MKLSEIRAYWMRTKHGDPRGPQIPQFSILGDRKERELWLGITSLSEDLLDITDPP